MRACLVAAVLVTIMAPVSLFAQERGVGQGRLREDFRGKNGPYRVDMWYTENAFIMNKVRAEAFYLKAKDEGDGWTFPLQGEWALTEDISLWGLVSYKLLNPAHEESRNGIGDSELAVKWAAVNKQSLVFSLVGRAVIPTADENKGFGDGVWRLGFAPRLWLPFGPGNEFELQVDAPVVIPLEQERENTGEVNVALAWTSDIALTLLVEGVFEYSFEGSGPNSWVAPGFQFQFLRGWMLGASVTFPVNGHEAEEEDYRIAFGLLKEWHLPWEAHGRE